MRKNVGLSDALIRITLGLVGLSYSTAKMVRCPHRTSPMIIAILSAMKVAEGIIRFCPMLTMLGVSTANNRDKRPYRISSYPRRCR